MRPAVNGWDVIRLAQGYISKGFGKVAAQEFPKPVQKKIIQSFAKLYKINVDEAARDLAEYPSLVSFFSRELKEGLRPISSKDYVHPVDGQIVSTSLITRGALLQAKNIWYELTDLILNEEISRKLEAGIQVTYYLSPQDYHRIHSPADIKVNKVRYIPGFLWPVNQTGLKSVSGLFCKNERVVIEAEYEGEPLVIVFVGALNVGSMVVEFLPELETNKGFAAKTWDVKVDIPKGSDIGHFKMGSTVIVLASAKLREKFELEPHKLLGLRVKVNS